MQRAANSHEASANLHKVATICSHVVVYLLAAPPPARRLTDRQLERLSRKVGAMVRDVADNRGATV